MTELGFAPSENPYVVEHGGFYRRWLSMIDDIDELRQTVSRLEGTTQDHWVPVWQSVGEQHEEDGDRLETAGDPEGARRAYLQAKTYYAIGRFPGEITPAKTAISEACSRAYRKAGAHLDPPIEVVDIHHQGQDVRGHFRAPKETVGPVPAVLVMCGADVFKEDRGWAAELALDNGLASIVMDGPGTGENPFPWSPASVSAWEAAIDYLASRPEVDQARIGAFGISRGGYSVMQLAGTVPDKVHAIVANAGHPFGYRMTDDEMKQFVGHANRRAEWRFGDPDGPPSFSPTTRQREEERFETWALSELGLVERITQPVFMINGKHDHLAPIGNIYFMLESGTPGRRCARIYSDAGHCAFKYHADWAPASFSWLQEKLSVRSSQE